MALFCILASWPEPWAWQQLNIPFSPQGPQILSCAKIGFHFACHLDRGKQVKIKEKMTAAGSKPTTIYFCSSGLQGKESPF